MKGLFQGIREGFVYGISIAWRIVRVVLIALAILLFVSCTYWLDHLRFNV